MSKPKEKKIKAWAVVDFGDFIADGSGHMAIYFDKSGAVTWRKEMIGLRDKHSEVVPCEIILKVAKDKK